MADINLENSLEWLNLYVIPWGIRALLALAIFLIGRWLARYGVKTVKVAMHRAGIDTMLVNFLASLLYWAIMAAVIIATLGQLGINTTSLLALLGAAGLAVGLALKDSLANFASGVLLILFRPFRIGDSIEGGGASGTVEDIRIFNTVLRTGDNRVITIPNSQMHRGTIINISAKETRRIDLLIGIGYDDDIRQACSVIRELVDADERILAEPEPTINVAELADSSVNLNVRPWVRTGDYGAVRAALLERIKLEFDARDITLPYPQREVHLHQVEA